MRILRIDVTQELGTKNTWTLTRDRGTLGAITAVCLNTRERRDGQSCIFCLMGTEESWVNMSDIAPMQTHGSTAKGATHVEEDIYDHAGGSSSRVADNDVPGINAFGGRPAPGRPKPKQTYSHTHFKVYKRRWLGLGQLVLLNIVVSWDVRRSREP